MDLIQQLKENEKPFGLMSAEMQEKAREIGLSGNFENWSGNFIIGFTYRLRPDYEEKPEIVECEIYEENTRLYFRLDGSVPSSDTSVEYAVSYPDFIGFKFEDGVILPYPVKYGDAQIQNIYGLRGGTIYHATHVLFRRQP